MILRKWNYKTHKYDSYKIPDSWNTPMIAELEEIVNCVQCGKAVEYGETYTSLEIHDLIGLGFAVCKDCYDQEWKRKVEARNEKIQSEEKS